MKKTFKLENDIGMEIEYTILGFSSNDNEKYVIFTNGLSADNVLGKRLFAGLVEKEEPFTVKRLRKVEEKEIVSEFISNLTGSFDE